MHSQADHLRVLHLSAWESFGGAERVARNLFEAFRSRGYTSWLAVGSKQSDDPDIFEIPNDERRTAWARAWRRGGKRLAPWVDSKRGVFRLQRVLWGIAEPLRSLATARGFEDFHYPAAYELLDLTPRRPTVVHCQNLHGGYFDLRALPRLSAQVPFVLTLQDAWTLSGHCAHSFACERWKTGCGECPDLTIYPAVPRDATAANWQRKREIYAGSRLYVATPCEWLMDKVTQSILAPGIVEAKVVHNGVNLSVFRPGDPAAARAALALPPDAKVLLFAAAGIRTNIWKDYETLRAAIAQVAAQMEGRQVICVALGEDSPPEWVGGAELRFVPYHDDPAFVASYYQAADVYVHAAKQDTFPNTVMEALACGTPVVATAVGGVPEQVREGQTGFLSPLGDARAMAEALVRILSDDGLRASLAGYAADDARRRFGLEHQVDEYLGWYEDMLAQQSTRLVR